MNSNHLSFNFNYLGENWGETKKVLLRTLDMIIRENEVGGTGKWDFL